MYKAFQYRINEENENYNEYICIGKQRFNQQREKIKNTLGLSYIDGYTLDGRKLADKWFPQQDGVHIFLSHAHRDVEEVYAFSGFLYENFKLNCFIDSAVWGYADELLMEIDNKHACKEEGLYDYYARNRTTSNVYLLLNNALLNMMDRSECVMFLNTPNSISTLEDRFKDVTFSPWIYSELNMLDKLQINIPERISKPIEKYASFRALEESVRVAYDIDEILSHLPVLDSRDFQRLKSSVGEEPLVALDMLYEMKESVTIGS